MSDEFSALAKKARRYKSAERFALSAHAPERYRKVAEAYHAPESLRAASIRVNQMIRERVLAALETSSVTRYRLCKDLGLNMGNVYAYLSGDPSKVSTQTAQRILDYTLALQR